MYISTNWIKDFVNLDGIDLEDLIYKFTMSTAEVEGITKYGENTQDVIVAEIVNVDNVENSKKLHKLIVNTGVQKFQVICGAPNVEVGAKVAFAKVGSLVNGEKIEKATLAGVDSFGMCLSEKELGISDDNSGIIILGREAKIGQDIKEIIPMDDVVFEVDNKSLTNRPDLWGHYGIAREIATITNRELRPLDVEDLDKYNNLEKLQIGVEAKDENNLCLRYSAMRIDNVNKKQADFKIRVRLFYCGMRSINLLADMTNYIMLELGQPMHAFDSKKINNIYVKQLEQDTTFVTLDSQTRNLEKGTLMITSNNIPVAIAGVMGGEDSEITDSTTSLFLESANFNAVSIRKTASKLDLRTDAAARYEKTLDPELTKLAIARFLYVLRNQVSDIHITSSFSDVYIEKYPEITIEITKDYIDKSIGKVLSLDEILTTLKNLEFKVNVSEDKNRLTIEVPSFRATKDVSQKVDIIEEIARIHGYDNIEPKTNLWKIEPVNIDETLKLEYNVKELLATKYGLNELHSYVWYDTNKNQELGIETQDNVKIVNGIVKLDSTLRHEMAPTMLYTIDKNLKYMSKCNIFEIGRTFDYNFDGKDVKESKVLGIGLSDTKASEKELVYEAKSIVDSIVNVYKNLDVEYENIKGKFKNYMHPVNTFKVLIKNTEIGYISVVHPKITDKINKKAAIVVCEIDINKLSNIDKHEIVYTENSKYQEVSFDLSVIVDKDTMYKDIKKAISEAQMEYLKEYELIDIYENAEKLLGKKAITIRFTIVSNTETLTKEQIDSEREKLLNKLQQNEMYIMQ